MSARTLAITFIVAGILFWLFEYIPPGLAAILFVTGLLAMVGCGVLIALFCVALICFAVYGIVRAIGWVIGEFIAPRVFSRKQFFTKRNKLKRSGHSAARI